MAASVLLKLLHTFCHCGGLNMLGLVGVGVALLEEERYHGGGL